MPLIERIVRDESGASPLLKSAAVRAVVTAVSGMKPSARAAGSRIDTQDPAAPVDDRRGHRAIGNGRRRGHYQRADLGRRQLLIDVCVSLV